MRVLASSSSTIRARYRHIEDGFPRSICSSRPVDISTSINPYRARFPELHLFIEAGWRIELDKLVSSSVAQITKLIPSIVSEDGKTLVWHTWQGYHLGVLSRSSHNISQFSGLLRKICLKQGEVWPKFVFKQSYCDPCHTRFAVVSVVWVGYSQL